MAFGTNKGKQDHDKSDFIQTCFKQKMNQLGFLSISSQFITAKEPI